jgi:hypothetical protein
MMLNIKTGYGGITKVPNEDVVIFVSSMHKLSKMGIPFLFTDRHAYLINAEFFSDLSNLSQIDWQILQDRNFKRDPDDPGKVERYQAEALVHNHIPIEAFIGVVCYSDKVKDSVLQASNDNELNLQVVKQTGWYF